MKKNNEKNILYFVFSLCLICLAMFIFAVPDIRFKDDLSTVVLSENGELLGAKIARDEQWRFPPPDSLPIKFKKAALLYEDHRFEYHKGVDIVRILKALYDNLSAHEIVSGGSTIHMQLARIYRKNPPRNWVNKFYELLLAVKLEYTYDKATILKMYAANAPFGGNIVGIEAASWRYFGKEPNFLTWAETATLAVLPNSPALIHPGRNRNELKRKRDVLLRRLFHQGEIDSAYLELSLLEALPDKPYQVPQLAPHLVANLDQSSFGTEKKVFHTSIDRDLQIKVMDVVRDQQKKIEQTGIHNIGVLILDNENSDVLVYVGNTVQSDKINHEHYVDMIRANRSSGSILKPLLYGLSLDAGLITTSQLLPDIPGRISGYRPRNFDRGYEGAVPANKALARSLNIPAVYLLQDYSIDKFLLNLKDLGISTIDRSADHYGLPLILGGADVNLWELTGVYASLARTLNGYNDRTGKYLQTDIKPPDVIKGSGVLYGEHESESFSLSAGSIWLTFDAITQVERPDELGKWEKFGFNRKIAWKTGTSYGFRDAWAVGVSKRYTVGVWVGNATGEGRPGMTGVRVAAPVLFNVFGLLPASPWFEEPADDLKEIMTCESSGYPVSPNCDHSSVSLMPFHSNLRAVCPYHQILITDQTGRWRLNESCDPKINSQPRKHFILPPLMEYYYAKNHPEYQSLPAWHPSCNEDPAGENTMAFIYPTGITKVLIPVEYDNQKGRAIFKLAHRHPGSTVFWYLDDDLIATTVDFHEVQILKDPGIYTILVVDQAGHTLEQEFEVVQ